MCPRGVLAWLSLIYAVVSLPPVGGVGRAIVLVIVRAIPLFLFAPSVLSVVDPNCSSDIVGEVVGQIVSV
jgi:hypothetical protein